MKISMFFPDLRGGGVERVRILLAVEFIKAGHSVDFVLLKKEGLLLDMVPPEVNIVNLDSVRIRNAFFPLVKYLRCSAPDFFIAAMWPLTTIACIAKRVSGFKGRLVLSEHNNLSSTFQANGVSGVLLRFSLRHINGIFGTVVGVSEGVLDDLHSLGLPSRKGVVINNPVKLYGGKLSEEWLSHPWMLEDKVNRILAVGSLKKQKDFYTLIEAVGNVKKNGRAVKLLILGEGALLKGLLRFRDDLGLNSNVYFGGFEKELKPFFESASLFVLSSAWEGLGNVISEALTAGTPVVATNCKSGPAEILENGKYGKLVPVGDSAALANAIEESLDEPFNPEALKARGKDFSPEVIAKKYLDLFSC